MQAMADLEQAIDALRIAFDNCAAAAGLPGADAASLQRLQELRCQVDRLEALWVEQVGQAHRSGAASAEGYVTTSAFLRHVCRLAPGAARARVDVSLQLDDRPALAAVFAAGEVSFAHVKAITDALAPLPPQAQVDAEPVLIEAARHFDAIRVAQAGRRLRRIVDPDGQAGLDERHRERRWLDIATTFDGVAVLRGLLDTESAQLLSTAIDSLSSRAGELDERTPAQRRADALIDLARHALDAGELPVTGGERPHINVIVDLASLRAQAVPVLPSAQDPMASQPLFLPEQRLSGQQTVPQRSWLTPAEFIGGESISADTARRLSCDAIVTRIAVDPTGRTGPPIAGPLTAGPPTAGPPGIGSGLIEKYPVLPAALLQALPAVLRGRTQALDVGRSARTATAAIRKALAVRDRGCVMPGCDRPPPACEAHHIIHWIDGGVTALYNMVLLCPYHHHFLHERHWNVKLRPDGSTELWLPESAIA